MELTKEEEFNLSKKAVPIGLIANYRTKDVKEFIIDIQNKVLLNWKGQNEFIDWLRRKTGEKLIEVEK